MSETQVETIDMTMLAQIVRKEVRAAVSELFVAPTVNPRHVNYERMSWISAALQSAELLAGEMHEAVDLVTNERTLEHALSQCEVDGLVMEFGVCEGRSLTRIAALTEGDVHGFDSFEGLPEDWSCFQKKGRFSLDGQLPALNARHVKLHKGWFEDSLPLFLAAHPGPARLVHIDCDLYSSTDTVLRALQDRLVPGSVIVFDEYLNYPGWQKHEYKAFREFLARTGARFRYLGFASSECAVSVRIV